MPAIVASALIAAACGAGGDGSGGSGAGGSGGGGGAGSSAPKEQIPAAAKDNALAAQVPAEIAQDGKMVIGADTTYAPNEFVDNDGKTVIGMDVDLGKAIAQKLGLQAEFTNADFAGIIPGLAAGKFELAISSFTVNSDREAQVDMVSYFTAGVSMAVPKGNPDHLTLDTLCGKTVAVQKGTVEVDDLTQRSATCKQQGKPAIDMKQFQNQTDVTLALNSKRAVAMLADTPVTDYAIKQTNGQLETADKPFDSAPYGIAVPKGKGAYTQAIQGAVQQLMDDGTYQKIVEKWGVQAGSVKQAALNPTS